MSQAQTCDAVFQHLTQKAYENLNDIDTAERWLRLAFKAQGNSRATLETIGYLKHPPAVFAKQANMTTGPQQVNNNEASRVLETEFVQNEVLEKTDGKWMESGTPSGAGSRDPEVEAVGGINRAKNR